MKVLVFTQAYNAENTLPRAIESILGQTFQDLEYYILDNGSLDHTWDMIMEYARQDSRIIPISLKKNDLSNGGAFFWTLGYASDADYSVWLDADDTYSPRFLEKMTWFARENSLDIAMCGYDIMDGITGKLLRRRVLDREMIITGNGFASHFIEYRKCATSTWGRLYSLPFVKERHSKKRSALKAGYVLYADSAIQLNLLKDAERAGVYPEAMYQYYQYPHSLSRQNLAENLKGYAGYISAARRFLEWYGPISKENEDFLYAIYLSFADEAADHAFSADLSAAEKLSLLRQTFAEPLWAETLARAADPQFHNLAARAEYVAKMKERILALAVTPEEQALAEVAVRELDKPIAGGPASSAD